MKRYLLPLLCLVISACHPTKEVKTSTTVDREHTITTRLDSLLSARLRQDSVVVRDSVFMMVRGDSVIKYVERTRYKTQVRRDTVQRFIAFTDTVTVFRTDSVYVEKPVKVEKPWRWYDRGCLWLGRVCVLALLAWFLFLFFKRRL